MTPLRAGIPLIVLGSILVVLGIINFYVAFSLQDRIAGLEMAEFTDRFQPGNPRASYDHLYEHARSLHEQLAFAQREHGGFIAGAAMTLGVLCIIWGLDRRRLIKKCAAASALEAEGPGRGISDKGST